MSIPADKAQLTFYEAEEKEDRMEEQRERKKRGGKGGGESADAGAAMGRHPLTKHSAWDMAFTENSQMSW